jgi:hypothetical protein
VVSLENGSPCRSLLFSLLVLGTPALFSWACTDSASDEVVRTVEQPAIVSPLVWPEFDASDNPVSTRSIESFRDLPVEGAAGQVLYLFSPAVRGSGHFTPFGEFYDASGARQGTPFPIAVTDGNARYPRGAFDGTNWLVVWTEDVAAVANTLMGAGFTPSGEPLVAGWRTRAFK